MAFDKSALTAEVSQHAKELAIKAIAGAKTAQLLIDNGAVTTGVKGSARINKMNASSVFASGAGCQTRTASGDIVLANVDVVATKLKDAQNICPQTLYDTYFASMIGAGQDPEGEALDNAFVMKIMENRAALIAAKNEILLWQGDTTATGDNTKKWFDGILKQLASGTVSLTTAVGSYKSQMQAAFLGMPVAVRTQDDFRIFMGNDTYAQYQLELDNANRFNPAAPFSLVGTQGKIEVVPGLDGTGKVVFGRISDLHLGVDLVGDEDTASLKYSVETEQFYQDFHWSVGVKVVYADQMGVITMKALA